ncbi:MAG TPA: DMT family transporter [Ktedonobacterales bacterium]
MSVSSHAASATPQRRTINPRVGYTFAVLNAIISGFAIYINSIGVKLFHSSTLYTTLKNAVVGLALLIPFFFIQRNREQLRRLTGKQWTLLGLIALTGGSISYALSFRGMQITTPVTSALVDHTQFLMVGLLAALFLRERFGPAVWLALAVLFVGLTLGIQVNQVRLDAGLPYLIAGTLLTAIDFVIIKYALRDVETWTVMLFKMAVGAVILAAITASTGAFAEMGALSTTQWGFVLVTGLILLAFTITAIMGLRHASATGVTAISAASPIITTLLVVAFQHARVAPVRLLGLGLILVAAIVIVIIAQRQEMRAWRERAATLSPQEVVA